MAWIPLDEASQVEIILEKSKERPQLIFKHSTRCMTSKLAKNRLDKDAFPEQIDFYFLDLIKYRNISNKIAADYAVQHASPQVLLLKNGKVVYHESHAGISMEEIKEQIN